MVRIRGLCPITLGHMVTPSHSSLLGSLGDAVNHCPDPPAVQALAGKQIASHCSEFSTSFSLQTSYGWTDSTLSGKGRARIQYSQEASGSHWGYDQDICHSLLPSKGLMNGGLTQPTCSPIAPWPRLLQPTQNSVASVWAQLTFMLIVLSP